MKSSLQRDLASVRSELQRVEGELERERERTREAEERGERAR